MPLPSRKLHLLDLPREFCIPLSITPAMDPDPLQMSSPNVNQLLIPRTPTQMHLSSLL